MALNTNKREGDKLHAEEWNELVQEVQGKQSRLNIVDALDSDSAVDVLSAKQGKMLKGMIDNATTNVNNVADVVKTLPVGYFYGTFSTEESLPIEITEKGYAYVGTGNPYIIYTFDADLGWTATENKYSTPALETDLSTGSEVKAPTTKAVKEGIEAIDVTTQQSFTNSQKETARTNIGAQENITTMQNVQPVVAALNDRTAVIDQQTSVVKALGYKVLNPSLSFAEQVESTQSVDNSNLIFEIRDEFDLNGGEVTIPEGSILKFNGGRIINGLVKGLKMNTDDFGTPEMFGAGLTADDTKAVQSCLNVCKNVRLDGVYNVSADEDGVHPALLISSNTNLIINGSIELITNSYNESSVLRIKDAEHVKISGHGSLVGDRETHTVSNHEKCHGISMNNAHDIEIYDIEISQVCGDGIYLSYATPACYNLIMDNLNIHHYRRQGISVCGSHDIDIRGCSVHDRTPDDVLASGSAIDIETHVANNPNYNITVSDMKSPDLRLIVNPNSYQATMSNIVVENCNMLSVVTFNLGSDCRIYHCKLNAINLDYKTQYTVGNCPTIDQCAVSCFVARSGCNVLRSSIKGVKSGGNVDLGTDVIRFQYCDFDFLANSDTSTLYNNHSLKMEFWQCNIKYKNTSNYTVPAGSKFVNSTIEVYDTAGGTYTAINCEIVVGLNGTNSYIFNTSANTTILGGIVRIMKDRVAHLFGKIGSNTLTVQGVTFIDVKTSRSKIYGSQGTLNVANNTYVYNNNPFTYGTTANRPPNVQMAAFEVGYQYYDTTIGKPINWNGTSWLEEDGEAAGIRRTGTSSQRPTPTNIGFKYFDTTLGKPIYWNGTAWVDGNGNLLTEIQVSDKSVLLQASASSNTVEVYTSDTPTIAVKNPDDTTATWLSAVLSGTTLTISATANTILVAPEFVADTYYSKSGGVYTQLSTKPANWDTNYANYYTEEDGVYSSVEGVVAPATNPRGGKVVLTNTTDEVVINVVQNYV